MTLGVPSVVVYGDKRHYYYLSPAAVGQRKEVKAITTSTNGFALMFPSTTLNSPLSIIYLDPILGIMTFSESIFPSLSNHVHYALKFEKSAILGSLKSLAELCCGCIKAFEGTVQ